MGKRLKAVAVIATLAILVPALLSLITPALAQENPDVTIVLPDDGLMLVLYLKANDQYLQSIRGPRVFTIEGNKMYLEGRVIVNNLDKVGYEVYPWRRIEPKLEWDEEMDMEVEVPQYMSELDLQPITAADLPHSQHIAKLVDVDPTAVRPATVIRRYLGRNYTVDCLVSQSVKDMYARGDLQVGDYVIVSFIDEIPNTTEFNVCVVVDKVWGSW